MPFFGEVVVTVDRQAQSGLANVSFSEGERGFRDGENQMGGVIENVND